FIGIHLKETVTAFTSAVSDGGLKSCDGVVGLTAGSSRHDNIVKARQPESTRIFFTDFIIITLGYLKPVKSRDLVVCQDAVACGDNVQRNGQQVVVLSRVEPAAYVNQPVIDKWPGAAF